MKRTSLLCALMAAFLLSFFSLDSAQAQTFVCPSGPGPGEVQVGVQGGSHGVAAIPICAPFGESEPEEDEAAAEQPMPSVWVDSNVAVAWHANTDSVWATWGHRKAAAAEAVVLNACNATMGSGCTIAHSAFNSSIAIGRDKTGALWSSWGATEEEARAKLKKSCQDDNEECTVLNVYTGTAWREPAYFGELERRISDESGIHQQYSFPANSRVPPPGI